MLHPSDILIQEYTYDLPPEKIAAFPLENRSDSKVLIFKNETITESRFQMIETFLPQESVLIFNDTKVITARLHFENEKHQSIEIFCLGPAQQIDPSAAMQAQTQVNWNCLVGNYKRWKQQSIVKQINDIQLSANIVAKKSDYVEVAFSWTPAHLHFFEVLAQVGELPIPPYLNRKSTAVDQERYQTVYAQHKGSVAAPTAGLHFTNEILKRLKQNKVETIQLTLHVGAGTFKPVKSKHMADHHMHAEWMSIDIKTINTILKLIHKNIICVGTTSLRALETLYWMGLKAYYEPELELEELQIMQWDVYDLMDKKITAQQSLTALIAWMNHKKLERLACETQILIAPPYELQMAKGIFTNFHQPQSTLLLLVAAITGKSWREIYDYALEHDFRFLSYGDSSLLLK